MEKILKDIEEACKAESISECVFVGFSFKDGKIAANEPAGCITYCSSERDDLLLNTILSLVEILAIKRGMKVSELYAELYAEYGETSQVANLKGYKSVEDLTSGKNQLLFPRPKSVSFVEQIKQMMNHLGKGGTDGN